MTELILQSRPTAYYIPMA